MSWTKYDEDRFEKEKEKIVEEIHSSSKFEYTDGFNESAFLLANLNSYLDATKDVRDEMIEKNLAVFHLKESIKNARNGFEEIMKTPHELFIDVGLLRKKEIMALLTDVNVTEIFSDKSSEGVLQKMPWRWKDVNEKRNEMQWIYLNRLYNHFALMRFSMIWPIASMRATEQLSTDGSSPFDE